MAENKNIRKINGYFLRDEVSRKTSEDAAKDLAGLIEEVDALEDKVDSFLGHTDFVTEQQVLDMFNQVQTDLHNHNNKSVLDGITSDKVTKWDNKSEFDGNYNNLTNKPTIPTKTSELTNDSSFATETYVNNQIANAQLGGDDTDVDLSGYVTKEIGNASQITFSDGKTFQNKLDTGELKGNKGDQGEKGVDGLTTAISVNGQLYTHSNGIITLPNYPTGGGTGGTGEDTPIELPLVASYEFEVTDPEGLYERYIFGETLTIEGGKPYTYKLVSDNMQLVTELEFALGGHHTDGNYVNEEISIKGLDIPKAYTSSLGIVDFDMWLGGATGNFTLQIFEGKAQTSGGSGGTNYVYNSGASFVVFGDSYSTYEGWIPETHLTFYPAENITDVNQTWWWQLANETKMSLMLNDSWSGTTICGTGYDGDCLYTDSFVCRVATFCDGVRLSNKPDIIFLFGGTNDTWAESPVGSVKYDDISMDDLYYVLPAFCSIVNYIQTYIPGCRIINIVNGDHLTADIVNGMAQACEHYGIDNVVLSGIDMTNSHPTIVGMLQIKNKILEILEISDTGNPNDYTLPTASATTLGGVKVGDGLSITNGVLSVTGNTSSSSNNVLYLSPQQFGAVGDGVTDDLSAFTSMFNYMTENASDIDVGETSVKDFGKYEIIFTGKYAISDTFVLSNCYNLKIDRLNLVATNNFNKECLFKLTGITRNINFSNCIFDGNEYKASCLLMDEGCSDLNIKITDCNFRRFKAYGLKNIGTGHEMLINNCKINQYDWGCEGYPAGAIGLYIGSESHDHQIMNTIICYCSENLFINYGGSCFINNVHFYGPKVSIVGAYTFFNSCYFDSTCLEINGFNSVKNCFFLSGEENYFIKLTDTAENSWTYALTDIIGNRFNANTSAITTPIIADNIDINTLSINIYDNIFYNVTPICSKSEHVYNPSPYPKIWCGTQAEYDAIEWKEESTLYLIREE